MKGQLQRKMWSDKVSQEDHSKDGKGAKTEFSLQWSADKKDILSSVAKVSPFCLMSFMQEFWYPNAIMWCTAAWWSDKTMDTQPQDLRSNFWWHPGKNIFYEQNESFSYAKAQKTYTHGWLVPSANHCSHFQVSQAVILTLQVAGYVHQNHSNFRDKTSHITRNQRPGR